MMLSNKTRKELVDEVKDLIKVNNENFAEHQKVELDLIKRLREKDKEIANINKDKELIEKCCECRKYNKSIGEVVEAAEKHRNKVLEMDKALKAKHLVMKEIREELCEFSEENFSLKSELEKKNMEFCYSKENQNAFKKLVEEKEDEIKAHEKEAEMSSKRNIFIKDKLETTLREFQSLEENSKQKIEALEVELMNSRKQQRLNAKEESVDEALGNILDVKQTGAFEQVQSQIESLETRIRDLVDEKLVKDVEIKKLKALIHKRDSSLTSSLSSLEDELVLANKTLKLKNKIDQLENKLMQLKKNKEEKEYLINKMAEISEASAKVIDKIKEGLQKLTHSKNNDCRFGMHCSRRFCKFDHGYIFFKDNRIQNMIEKISCVTCDEKIVGKLQLDDHTRRKRTEKQHEHFENKACMNNHVKTNHDAQLEEKSSNDSNKINVERLIVKNDANKSFGDETKAEDEILETTSGDSKSDEYFDSSSNYEDSETEDSKNQSWGSDSNG